MTDTESNKNPLPYPKGAFFILGGYLTERFVYYGLFGAIVFYMQRVLGLSANTANTSKSVIESLIYFAPILGAILSDTYLGKVRTVTYMYCVYIVGAVVFTLSSVTPMMTSQGLTQAVGIGGMLVLGLSAGLMKAVYTSLGPDQFKVPEQRLQQQSYFSAFYWMINAGAFLGQLLTAQLRINVQCFNDDCYFLPFGLLCVLMIISLLIFISGRSRYIESPPDTTLIRVIKCIHVSVVQKFTNGSKPVAHWIDRAANKFDAELISDVKSTLRVLLLFVTYPLFWALFYQSSTGMIFQAKRLNDYVGDYRIPPELTSSINPLLILILIPLFELIVYPLFNKFNIFQRTTTRMTVGMMFSVFSFIIYAIVSSQTEQKLLGSNEARLQIYNLNKCEANINIPWMLKEHNLPHGDQLSVDFILNSDEYQLSINCNGKTYSQNIIFSGGKQTAVVIKESLITLQPTVDYIKDESAEAKVRVSRIQKNNSTVVLKYLQFEKEILIQNGMANFSTISPQMFDIVIDNNNTIGNSHIRQDGVYDIIIDDSKDKPMTYTFPVTHPTSVHVTAMIPQYLILTIGEVLFSVSSMDFAYAQVPKSMKSVMQAANLFTITIGLWIYAFQNTLNSKTGMFQHRPSYEAITYSVLMAINTCVFIFLVRQFNSSAIKEEVKEEELTEKKNGIDNPAFE